MPTYSPSYMAGYPDYIYESATPTPSPRGSYGQGTPARPTTSMGHARYASQGGAYSEFSPRPNVASPRYDSQGNYRTINVSNGHQRKHSFSTPPRAQHGRRKSYVFVRTSSPNGESDEDEVIEIDGGVFILPAQSKSKRKRHHVKEDYYYVETAGGFATDYHYYKQPGTAAYQQFAREAEYEPSPRPRRASVSTPQRPATARPASSHSHKKTHKESSSSSSRRDPRKESKNAQPAARKATDEDAKRQGIPQGYSLKNWDPSETPILLLGSVFDANSLGKWIYDWTVYRHGAATPISDMAGDLWLLLIQLSGKVKRSEESYGRVRSSENKELIGEFIASGERLLGKLTKLLKACEVPMLKSSKRKGVPLGKDAGVEFVETLFGRERELARTEGFMQNVRTFNLRFDANCEDILKNPTK